jgi:ketosteroid isomerase-like protein
MAEEGATPDLVELVRGSIEADSFDEWATLAEQLYTPDAVWDVGGMLGSLEGFAAIRAFVKDYWLMWDEHHHHVEEIVDLGNGVWFTVIREHGCIKGSNAVVEARNASVSLLADGRIVRAKTYTDVDKARAGAERLAQERG